MFPPLLALAASAAGALTPDKGRGRPVVLLRASLSLLWWWERC